MSLRELATDIDRRLGALNSDLDEAVETHLQRASDAHRDANVQMIRDAAYAIVLGNLIQVFKENPRYVYSWLRDQLRQSTHGLSISDFETDGQRRAIEEFLALGCAVQVARADGSTAFMKDALLEFLDEEDLGDLDQKQLE